MSDSRFWVDAVDGEAIGDHGGYTFGTRKEAESFIEATYRDELRLLEDGYYETRAELQALQITELRVVGKPIEYVIPKEMK